MRFFKALFILSLLCTPLFSAAPVHRIIINGVINPVAAEYIEQAVQRAENEKAQALLIQMDTPGGLMESMHRIMKSIQNAPIPVIVYVAPSGARAASAGMFITYAAHVAAMAPSTNIGSAHPVFGSGTPGGGQQDSLSGGIMMDKVTNDAIAKVRAVAGQRGRNADWAEEAIRESANITATEALKRHVIDYIAPTTTDLLRQLDSLRITLDDGRVRTLETASATVITFEMTWRQRLLDIIVNPNVAYILMMIGTLGIMLELYSPGAILPGVAGGIALITGFYALNTLPVNYAGFLLILFAIILFLLEIKVPSYGLLSIGGIIALSIGSVMLIDSPVPELNISWEVIVFVVIFTALFFLFAVGLALKAQRRKPRTGQEGLVGETGEVTQTLKPEGIVRVHGEYWRAHGDGTIKKGTRVQVVAVDKNHLILKVKVLD